jgi:hypothetical protein
VYQQYLDDESNNKRENRNTPLEEVNIRSWLISYTC